MCAGAGVKPEPPQAEWGPVTIVTVEIISHEFRKADVERAAPGPVFIKDDDHAGAAIAGRCIALEHGAAVASGHDEEARDCIAGCDVVFHQAGKVCTDTHTAAARHIVQKL